MQSASWRHHHGATGTTKTSKLLAAKRPDLIPIYDWRVGGLLFGGKVTNHWDPWVCRFRAADGDVLRAAAESVRDEVPAASHLSVLRVLDIVIWMHAHIH